MTPKPESETDSQQVAMLKQLLQESRARLAAVEAERAKACHLCGAPMKVEREP